MEHVTRKRCEIKARHGGREMPLYMAAIWEMGRVAYRRSMIIGGRMDKLAFLGILVVGRLQMYTSGLLQSGCVAPKKHIGTS